MSESLHTPIHAETELRCDDCNVLLGYMQEYEDTFDSPCSECGKDMMIQKQKYCAVNAEWY